MIYSSKLGSKVKVIGVGGAGMKAVNCLIDAGLSGVEFAAIDFNLASLRLCKAAVKLELKSLYPRLTFPEFGNPARIRNRESAVAEREQIRKIVGEADVVFIIAGLGGDMDSGVAPIVAETVVGTGALTVGVVTWPFTCEGKGRLEVAKAGTNDLRKHVDTLIVIPDDGILKMAHKKEMSVTEAFHLADDNLQHAVQCIVGLMSGPCLFAPLSLNDVEPLLRSKRGASLAGRLGIGWASSKNRAKEAAHMAIASPLLGEPLKMASGVLIRVACAPDPPASEIDEAVNIVVAASRPDARILYNGTIDDSLKHELCITVVCLYEQHELRIAV